MKRLTAIEKFKEGNSIQGFYLCVEKHLRHTRSGDLYLDLVLRDKTGQIAAKIWDKVSDLNTLFKTGDAKNVLYTVNNALTKITGKNSALFARYFSTAVLQQCFRKAYFGQKKWVFVQYF